MGFNFPDSPTLGQQFTPAGGPLYVYNGYGWDSAVTGSGAVVIGVQVITTSRMYYPSLGMVNCIIECVGGGGAGGGAPGTATNFVVGGGGGSGGYSRKFATAAQIGTSQVVTIGPGGTGVNGGYGNGGGATSVGSLCVAYGGGGGPPYPACGNGAAPGIGDVMGGGAPGTSGVNNAVWNTSQVSGWGGAGGSSPFGGGGNGAQCNGGQAANGGAATNYGSGGGGANSFLLVSNVAGGNGSSGIAIITEFGKGPQGDIGPMGPSGPGTGDVLRSGTPAIGEWAQWTDASHIQAVAAAATPFLQKAGGTMTGLLTLSGDPTAVLDAAPKRYVDQCGAPNCGVLTFVSTTQLKFAPFNGDRIRINGVLYQIPSAGIAGLGTTGVFINGVAGQNLVAGTIYYIYCFNNAGTLTACYWTSPGYTISTAAGNAGTVILSGAGGDAYTLIGFVRTITGSPTFLDQADGRYVRTWFNRQSIHMMLGWSDFQTTAVGVYTNMHTAPAWINWAGEVVTISCSGAHYNSVSNTHWMLLQLDGSGNLPPSAVQYFGGAGFWATYSMLVDGVYSEGRHYVAAQVYQAGAGTTHVSGTLSIRIG